MSSQAIEIRKQDNIVQAYSPQDLRHRINEIQRVIKELMKPGVHYGTMPGAKEDAKPVLLKPGSELLLAMFGIAIEPEIEDLSTKDEIRYRVKSRATSTATGVFLGTGVGECSSNEEKYKWKRTFIEKEYQAAEQEGRARIKYRQYKDRQGNWVDAEDKQIRTNPADVANTVLKMSKKRASSDCTLQVLACSDCFEQEEMADPDYVAAQGTSTAQRSEEVKQERQGVQRKTESNGSSTTGFGQLMAIQKAGGKPISDKQRGLLFGTARESGYSEDEVKAFLKSTIGTEDAGQMVWKCFDTILGWAKTKKVTPVAASQEEKPAAQGMTGADLFKKEE